MATDPATAAQIEERRVDEVLRDWGSSTREMRRLVALERIPAKIEMLGDRVSGAFLVLVITILASALIVAHC